MTLHAIEARLRMEPELNKLEANVMQALARAVMRFAQVTTKGGDLGRSSWSPSRPESASRLRL